MMRWVVALCAVIATSVAVWVLRRFELSIWAIIAAAAILACPILVTAYAIWQARQTGLDIEEGVRGKPKKRT